MAYDFGLRLRELRDKHGLTQEQVGKRIGISGATVSGYENNTINTPVDMVRKLALLYGVTTDYILGLEDRKTLVLDAKTPFQEKTIEQIFTLVNDLLKSTE